MNQEIVNMEELNIKIILLEEEMKFIREQLLELKRGETTAYHQLLTKYNETIQTNEIEQEKTIIYQDKEYTIDKNNFLWDMDGYVSGWIDEKEQIILNNE